MKKYLYSNSQITSQVALDQINSNCGWPNSNTAGWDNVRKAHEQEIYFFNNPQENGYSDNSTTFTRNEMMNNVIGVAESDGDSSWVYVPASDDDQP